jgi:hypothetical protein
MNVRNHPGHAPTDAPPHAEPNWRPYAPPPTPVSSQSKRSRVARNQARGITREDLFSALAGFVLGAALRY